MLLRLLTVLTCCSVFCPAQQGGESTEEYDRRKRAAIEAGEVDVKPVGKGEKVVEKDSDEAMEKLTPEQRLQRNIHHGAASFCTFVATPKPARLMPGQSGVIVVTAILKGQAVLPSPAPLELVSPPTQGLITLGSLAFRPAEPGRLAAGYVGRPVYDNWAIFEVPVTMGAGAVVGRKVPVGLELKFDLFDGTSAQPIGRFLDRANTEIEVGQSADPSVAGGMKPAVPPAAGPGVSAPTGEPKTASTDADAGTRKPPETRIEAAPSLVAPDRPQPEHAAAPQTTPAPAPGVTDEEGGLPLPLMLGGGTALLALVLLFARRKGTR